MNLKKWAVSVCFAMACGMAAADNPGEGALAGDSCQSNNDCDKDVGQHCIKNVCKLVRRPLNPDSETVDPTPVATPATPSGSACPGVPSGMTVKCQLYSGPLIDACGTPGAIPAVIGSSCHIGMELGKAVP